MVLTQDRVASLARKDPLSFGIFYIDLLEGKQWEINSRMWSKEIYYAVNPWLIEKEPLGHARTAIVQKSTQAGISTWAMVKMFHFATNWPVRIFYTLPRQQDTLDMASTRIDPMITNSPYLKKLQGIPNSAHAKRIGDSYLFFMELNVEPRMMPADALFVDEVDLSNPDNMGTAINRLDASKWKLMYFLSTPSIPGYGINSLYDSSDKREWMVKCPKCNSEQPIDWDINLRVIGAHNNPKKVYYGCAKCDAEISVEHMQTGRWVAEFPERTTDIVGYHIHQLFTTNAENLYKIYRNPLTTLVEFYRKRLGKPYEQGSGSISRDDILVNCFHDTYNGEVISDGTSVYYMGVDQGNELQIVIAKKESNSAVPKVVHIELVPMDKGFDRVGQLMNLYRIKRAVVDGNPNRHEAIKLAKAFPGRVLIADYIDQKDLLNLKHGISSMPKIITNVTINRTAGFDSLIDSIKSGMWAIYGGAIEPDKTVELLIDHVTALKRDVETRKLVAGSVDVGVWKNTRPDHLAHSWLYLKIALDSFNYKKGKVATGTSQEVPTIDITEEEHNKKVQLDIIALLAEVPVDQLKELVTQDEYIPDLCPFPLSYKLQRCFNINASKEQIEKAIKFMILHP